MIEDDGDQALIEFVIATTPFQTSLNDNGMLLAAMMKLLPRSSGVKEYLMPAAPLAKS